MGTLDNTQGSLTKRRIQIIDISSYTVSQLENAYNNNYGIKGWRIVQIVQIGNKNYIVAEQEYV